MDSSIRRRFTSTERILSPPSVSRGAAAVVVDTNLANLNDGDPGSVAELAFGLTLDNAAAQSAHPGGDYWIVLANTMAGDGTGGQLHLDRISVQTGDATDPGPNVPPPPPIAPGDQVDGDLIMFSDNGGWCWYQGPRAIVTAFTTRGRL